MSNVLEDIIMVSQINDSSGMKAIGLNRVNANDRKEKEPVAEQPSAASDSVNLSQAAKKLEAIKSSLKNAPEVDAKKVAYFKNQVATGNYQPDSNKIAQRMLERA